MDFRDFGEFSTYDNEIINVPINNYECLCDDEDDIKTVECLCKEIAKELLLKTIIFSVLNTCNSYYVIKIKSTINTFLNLSKIIKISLDYPDVFSVESDFEIDKPTIFLRVYKKKSKTKNVSINYGDFVGKNFLPSSISNWNIIKESLDKQTIIKLNILISYICCFIVDKDYYTYKYKVDFDEDGILFFIENIPNKTGNLINLYKFINRFKGEFIKAKYPYKTIDICINLNKKIRSIKFKIIRSYKRKRSEEKEEDEDEKHTKHDLKPKPKKRKTNV